MILGITGTNGAGKGAVVDYLVEKKGFTHYSVRQGITEEILRRGLEVNRTNTRMVATQLRTDSGPAYFTELFINRMQENKVENGIIESIRAIAEAENIRHHGGLIVAVDAPREMRYDRITKRGSATDAVSFEQFCIEEDREMTPVDPNDPAQMNMKRVMETADYTIINDGSYEELAQKIERMLGDMAHA